MDISTIIPHTEALIFASEKPLATIELVELVNSALGFIEDRASPNQVESAIEAIVEKYNSEFYPFEVKQSGGGWQFLTKKDYYKTVAQLNGEKFLKKLSTAALETLAIIAYKQPVTKGEIENIRGVNCDYAVQKLLEKELIVITGRKENAPGQPLIYATSKSFMDYFGINSVEDLPKLKDIIASDIVSPTEVGTSHPVDEDIEASIPDNNRLVVTETGDIEELSEEVVVAEESVLTDAAPVDDVDYANEESANNGDDANNIAEDAAYKQEDKKQEDAAPGEADESATT
jgi:segregation and condensation protein B